MNPADTGTKRQRAGVRRPLKHQLRIDMTPMVDLGFLLISFFVITTELSKPKVMPLNMPKDGKDSDLGESYAFTVLLDAKDRAWYYQGNWEDAVKENAIYPLDNPLALRSKIQAKQRWLDEHPGKEGRDGLMVLVKSTNGASYRQVVDVLDEMAINDVKKYAVVKLDAAEAVWVHKQE